MTDILASFDGNQANAVVNSAAWVVAIAAAQASDRTIVCPPGVCVVAEPVSVENVGVAIRAPHREATTIALADGVSNHVVSFKNTVGGGLFDITIDGNRANQTLGHCIRGESVDRLTIARVLAKNARHYGLGLQGGVIKDLMVDDLIVEDTGGDGIDFKNTASGNSGNILRGIRIRRHGLIATDQAGIDLRGPTMLSDIIVEEFGESHVGIRFREDGPSTGPGAHQSVLTGFRIIGASKVSTLGISCIAQDVTVSNGYIENVLRPVQCQAEMFSAVNVRAHDCTDGAYAANPGGDDATFIGFRVTAATKALRSNRPRAEFASCLANSCGTSIYADAGGTQMRVTGGRSIGPATAHKGGTLANIYAPDLLEAS